MNLKANHCIFFFGLGSIDIKREHYFFHCNLCPGFHWEDERYMPITIIQWDGPKRDPRAIMYANTTEAAADIFER